MPPQKILFLSDVVAELVAAREAGMQTGFFVRPGNRPADAGGIWCTGASRTSPPAPLLQQESIFPEDIASDLSSDLVV